MSLARVVTTLGQVIIRKLGDTGGPRTDQVGAELDNLIAWAKLSPRCIRRDTSAVGNVGLGLDVLHTFSLPANSLQTDGDYLKVIYGGTFAANDNDKRVRAAFGGTDYETTGATLDIDGAIGWRISAVIIRLSSTSVRVNSVLSFNTLFGDSAAAMNTFGASGGTFVRSNDITGLANLNSNATTMEGKGETAVNVNNDVIQNLSIIELVQQ